MRLAQFIQHNAERLLEDWETAVMALAPSLCHEGGGGRRDQARSVLAFVIEFIARDLDKARATPSGSAEGHAGRVIDMGLMGLSLPQMIQQLQALRTRITLAWGAEQGHLTEDFNELVRFHEAIDQLIVRMVSSAATLKADEGTAEAVVETAKDTTDRKKLDHDVWQNANFDSLTGIPNRRLFIDRLEQALLESQRNGSGFALLFIDLDRFRQANAQLGHEAGDQLLLQVAQRINGSMRAADTLARLGGDEFALILKETGKEGAKEAARALVSSMEQAFTIDSYRVHISCSIGITFSPEDGTNIMQLMHNADQAMSTAKENGGQQVQIYESWMSHNESVHMRLNRELDLAIRDDQLEVYYQPIIDMRTGAISRAEALLRWNHPSRGLLTPDVFLPVTEQNCMTNSITALVLEQAVICSLRWRDQHDNAFPININESPASFDTRGLVEEWRTRLTKIGLRESRITMELTPGSFDNIRASGFNPIRSLGLAGLRLHLALDDFGIKPFSLATLQEFRMESIKVDRALIRNAGQGGDEDDVLEAIIAMAHAIDVEVIGVGVEMIEQLNFLTRIDCDYAQGFLFSEPVNQKDFEALLELDRRTPH